MTPFQIQQRAAEKCNEMEQTCIRAMFEHNWRVVSIMSVFIGWTPFPDASLVLPPYGAARALDQLKEYVLADKDRHGAIPVGTFILPKAKPNVDYFLPHNRVGIRAMINYGLSSVMVADADIHAIFYDPSSSYMALLNLVRLWKTATTFPDGTHPLLWPSVYWAFQRDAGVRVHHVHFDGTDGDAHAITDFQPSVFLGTRRGQVPNWHSAYDQGQPAAPPAAAPAAPEAPAEEPPPRRHWGRPAERAEANREDAV
jgi:hypothetical protein